MRVYAWTRFIGSWVCDETRISNPDCRRHRPGPGRSPLAAAPGARHRPAGALAGGAVAARVRERRELPVLSQHLPHTLWLAWQTWGVIRLPRLRCVRWAADVVSIFVIYTTIAARDLARHSMAVFRPLAAGDLVEARRRVAAIVGRDTRSARRSGRGPGGRGKRRREHRGRGDGPAVLRRDCRSGGGDGLSRRQHAGFDVRSPGRPLSADSAGRRHGSTTWPTICRPGSPPRSSVWQPCCCVCGARAGGLERCSATGESMPVPTPAWPRPRWPAPGRAVGRR